jgi:uncharacterized protein with GYD domain
MSKYIELINWTEKGIMEAQDAPARIAKSRDLARSLGGDMLQIYMTMGSYDLVAVFDMPSDEAMAKYVLKSAAGGHIRSTTLKAFDEANFRDIIGSL